MKFLLTPLTILGIFVYRLIALVSERISFNVEKAAITLLFVLVIELIANYLQDRLEKQRKKKINKKKKNEHKAGKISFVDALRKLKKNKKALSK